MQNRRTFLGIAAASLLPIGIDAQTGTPAARTQRGGVETATPRPAAELARHALTGPLEGFEAVLVELNIPPGARSSGPGHRHPGPVLGYIVEGQMRFAINNEPEQVLPVGRTFFEPSGAVHTTTGLCEA
jgi:quercetin dioxygenase-like cupin family protein